MAKKQPVSRDILGVTSNSCPNDDAVLNVVEEGQYRQGDGQAYPFKTGSYYMFKCPECGYTKTLYNPPFNYTEDPNDKSFDIK